MINEVNNQIKPRPVPYFPGTESNVQPMPLNPDEKINPSFVNTNNENSFSASSVGSGDVPNNPLTENPNITREEEFHGPDKIEASVVNTTSSGVLNKNVNTKGYNSNPLMRAVIPENGAPIEYNPSKPPEVAAVDKPQETEIVKKNTNDYVTGNNPYKGSEIKD